MGEELLSRVQENCVVTQSMAGIMGRGIKGQRREAGLDYKEQGLQLGCEWDNGIMYKSRLLNFKNRISCGPAY